jgi:adenylate cyclase
MVASSNTAGSLQFVSCRQNCDKLMHTVRGAFLTKLTGTERRLVAISATDVEGAEFDATRTILNDPIRGQCPGAQAQAALASANSSVAPDRHINFRIGIHVGDVMVQAGELFGDGVNVAARLQTAAAPGGVSISGMT